MRHTDIWKAVDSLAERNGLSASGLGPVEIQRKRMTAAVRLIMAA